MKKPPVSIGMPVYNGEMWIRRALESLLNQDYPNIQIVVSDNASDDNTLTIIKEYAKKYQKISILENKKNIGVFKNFKNVLINSTGKYFMWAAVDDFWAATYVSTMVNKLENDEKYAVVQSATMLINENNLQKIGYVRFIGENNPENCSLFHLTKNIISPLKYNFYIYGLFRRTLLVEAANYMPSIPSSDRWFLLQFPLAGYKLAYVDEPLYIRTIANEPLYIRYPDEELAQQIKNEQDIKGNWYLFNRVKVIRKMLNTSSLLKDTPRIYINIVLLQNLVRIIRVGTRMVIRHYASIILPKRTKKLIKKWLKIKQVTKIKKEWTDYEESRTNRISF